jgi:hypothetical protein
MPLAAVAAIGGIGSIVSGVVGSNAASHAADTQATAANNAANLERQSATDALNFNKLQYGNSLNLLSPYYNTGVSANNRLAQLMGLRPAQGLPAGVINPNAPTSNNGVGAGFQNLLDNNPNLRLPGGGLTGNAGGLRGALRGNTAMPQDGAANMSPQSATAQTTPGQAGTFQNPDAGRFAPGATPGGAAGGAGMLQIGPDGQPTGTTPDVNPFPNGVNLGGGPTPATTNQGGTGQVPQTGGTPLGDPSPFGHGGMGDLSGGPNGGAFGSLATGWNQTFQSPTGVTEQNDPGYQFRLQQGQQALQNSAAARGGLLSGGTAKALTDYNQNAASGEYGNVYNRALQNYNTNYNTFTNDQTNTFNRLQALSGGGQTAANNLSASGITAAGNAANIGLTSAGQIGQQINNAGAANASGYINSANAINGAIGGATNSLSTLAMLRMLQQQGG